MGAFLLLAFYSCSAPYRSAALPAGGVHRAGEASFRGEEWSAYGVPHRGEEPPADSMHSQGAPHPRGTRHEVETSPTEDSDIDPWEWGPEDAEQEEFALLEHFEQNPLDLASGEAEEFLLLPGFPEALAERIIEARSRARTRAQLLARLTPPELEILRRYEAYISLPRRRPVGFETRFTVDRIGKSVGRRQDVRCIFESGILRASVRVESGDAYRHYLSFGFCREHIRLHGGDFSPDLAMGLLFSSYSSTYPFSNGYHIRKKRWIAVSSSFYSASVRGAAAEVWLGRARMLAFRGRRCRYEGERLDAHGDWVTGGRLEVTRRCVSLGVNAYRGGESRGGIAASVDALAARGCFEAAGELVLAGGEAGCIVGLGARSGAGRASIAIYDIDCNLPADFSRPFYGRHRARRGVSLVLRRRLAGRRLEALCALEHAGSSNIVEKRGRNIVRLECRFSARRTKIKISYRFRTEERAVMVPFPPGGGPYFDESSSLALLQNSMPRKGLRIRFSLRAPLEREARGYLICPSVTIGRSSNATISWALHRATRGRPVFYCYERSLGGLYPWRALRGDGWRVALIGEMHIGPLRLGIGFAAQRPGGREASLQAKLLL
jgi:hypothetical protein